MARIAAVLSGDISNSGLVIIGRCQHLQVRALTRLFGLAALMMIVFQTEFNSRVLACTCSPEASAPACQLISRASVAFLGECIELLPDPNGGSSFGRSIYRFRVLRVYKGLDPDIREVLVNPDTFTSCATEYPTGKTYLMFAGILSKDPLTLVAGGCSGSRRADLNKSDVDYLEGYVKGNTETVVYGKVLQWVTWIGRPREDETAPVEGARMVLANSTDRFTSLSQSDGSFRFPGIPAGEYQLSAQLDPYVPDPISYQVVVSKGGCKEIFVQLKPLSTIEGILLKPDGRPAAKQRVELLRRNEKGAWYSTYKMWTQTDNQGKFKFEDIGSGDYLLGFEIWSDAPSDYSPYPTQYFPGVRDRPAAEIISLAPKQAMKDLRLTLPPPHKERTISIRVIWPDGKPPGTNLLQVFHDGGLIKNLEGAGHGGAFTFKGYQEREYEFNARYWVDNLGGGGPVFSKRIAKADPVKLAPGKEPVEIVLVLNNQLNREDER